MGSRIPMMSSEVTHPSPLRDILSMKRLQIACQRWFIFLSAKDCNGVGGLVPKNGVGNRFVLSMGYSLLVDCDRSRIINSAT
ncbi:hypothetical protein EVC37_24545 [Methylocaldum sp. BRCS4]|jgi:hypothetical protein|uniref:hypothetical protein n=1 Tax=Methylocaldum sp. TaxID=1969727 RepID=UPI00111C6B55|nr:hypothetical protein [Methylocaldum sp. BRCS4]